MGRRTKDLEPPVTEPAAVEIVRAHFAQLILDDLRAIQPFAGQPAATVYANRLLRNMRLLRDRLPHDPYVEAIMAVYDGLAFDNYWCHLSAERFEGVRRILGDLLHRENITDAKVQKVISAIEELGIDTTPIPFGGGDRPDGEEESDLDG